MPGSAKKEYTMRLKDAKGLYSKSVTAMTQLNEPQQAQAAVITGTKIASLSGNGTTQERAIVIKAAALAPEAQIKLSVPDEDVTIHYTLTEVGHTPGAEQTGTSPVTVDMPLNGAGEKGYALTYHTDGVAFKPSASTTVYYKVLKEHTVTFNLAGGNIDGSTNAITMTGLRGTPFTKPVDPIKEGYTFNDWNPSLPTHPVFPAADTTYTAQWTANQYKVHFNGNDSTGGLMSDQTFTYGTSQALRSNGFTKDGYTFKGWAYAPSATSPTYTDGQSVENLTVTKDAVVQLYAVWHINTYTVKFRVDGEQGGSLKGTYNSTPKIASGLTEQQFESVPYGSTIIFTATPAAGYEVDGWTGAVPDPGDNKKTSLTVQDSVTVTVKFKAVGGQSPAVTVSNWEALRTAVQNASDGTVIEIAQNLTYDISHAVGKDSIIEVNKNITIKSKGSGTYTLNAGGKGADSDQSNTKSTGIFEVSGNKTLTLENLILTKTEKYAVYVAEGDNSLTMKNVTIKDCKTEGNAAGIYFNKGKDLTLENCRIEKCKGKGNQSSGGIDIQAPKGTVRIKNTTIENCEAKANGGGINMYNAQCTLERVTVNNCSALRGGGLHVKAGTLTITGGSFTKNVTSAGKNQQGGAIYSEDGSLTLKGCMIGGNTSDEGNTAKKGGGIYLKNVALTMQSVTVKNNKASTQGGGIYLADGELKIPGGNTIADNSATDNTASSHTSEAGGGIYVEKGTLTLNGGSIDGNSANANKGGGVYLNKTSSFIMNSGEIKNCSAKYGGGVFLAGTSTFTMKGGSITECKADVAGGVGGGIYTEVKTQLTLEGTDSKQVVISNCTAEKAGGGMLIHTDNPVIVKNARIEGNSANSGGGVYLEQGTFTIADSTRITPSTEATAGKNDVFLEEEKLITISDALTAESPIARITPKKYENGVKGLEGSPTECVKFTVTPNSEGSWSIKSDGTLKKP